MKLVVTSALLLALLSSCAGSKTESEAQKSTSPLLQKWAGPFGGVPPFDQVKVADFKPALEQAMAENRAEIKVITENKAAPTFANTIETLEASGETFSRVSNLFGVWSGSMSSKEFREVEKEMSPKLAAFGDELTQNTALFARIDAVNSNEAENGITNEKDRAQVWEIDAATGSHRVFASGLRNPVGMAWQPETGALWVAVNERDELGSDLVPDYMTAVRDGGFYGWPYSYFGQHVDTRIEEQMPELVAKAIVPDYALGPHTASLGLAYAARTSLPARFNNGMFVGQHGSWNRKPRSGYKVIFVPFSGGVPSGEPIDVLGGFIKDNGDAMGRPVGVAINSHGDLLVADDVGNTIWRVTGSSLRR